MASKRPHFSNPMCSVSGTWGADVSGNAGFEDAAQLRRGKFIRAEKTHIALCAASSKPIFILCLNPPCFANAAHGVTEVQPLRGYALCRTRQALHSAAKCGIYAFDGRTKCTAKTAQKHGQCGINAREKRHQGTSQPIEPRRSKRTFVPAEAGEGGNNPAVCHPQTGGLRMPKRRVKGRKRAVYESQP